MRAQSTGPGVVLDLIRSGAATTRRELIEELGWSRVTLARRLDELVDAGVVIENGALGSSGGRPPQELAVAKDAGLILAIDIGGSHTRLGITDLVSNVLVEEEADIGLYDGPDEIFSWATQVFDFLFARVGRSRSEVRAIGVGVPGPVDVRTGRLGVPQLDPRWEEVRIENYLGDQFDAVIAVDRDVNLLALGESRLGWPENKDLIVVKVGMGVGCAFVWDGGVYRGGRGGAGQLSAPRARFSDPLQRLETIASGAVARARLAELGKAAPTSAAVVALAKSGDSDTLAILDEIGEAIGSTLADVIALLNPEVVVIGGNLAEAGDRFLGAIRASALGTTHPFARRGLLIERSRIGDKAGVRGASLFAQDALFAPAQVDAMIREGRSLKSSAQ
jgi:predicted NBD/HSP70 family sugar kinase